ncbi:hypothetical protein [Actinomadura harenae]|uniref:Uncharacterized protein n=1 Tax=Actinomadura harenae TaxID=2483351 RepID=A0A3M2M783_9ACTN|nr:hypothetical protein [Actinomadura harenae]RMI45487.1 hypothetical protein EBO15_09770 [Actinomadura harenae]
MTDFSQRIPAGVHGRVLDTSALIDLATDVTCTAPQRRPHELQVSRLLLRAIYANEERLANTEERLPDRVESHSSKMEDLILSLRVQQELIRLLVILPRLLPLA